MRSVEALKSEFGQSIAGMCGGSHYPLMPLHVVSDNPMSYREGMTLFHEREVSRGVDNTNNGSYIGVICLCSQEAKVVLYERLDPPISATFAVSCGGSAVRYLVGL